MIMGGVSPEQMAAVQAVSQYIKGVMTIDFAEESIHIVLDASTEEAKALVPGLLDQLTEALATQLKAFFAIEGKIIEKNKPEAVPE